MTIEFPYATDDVRRPQTTLWLTEATARRFRGKWPSEFRNLGESSSTEPDHDLVHDDNSIVAEGVQMLENGWLCARVYFDRFLDLRCRVDLLLAPSEVIAVTSYTVAGGGAYDEAKNRQCREELERLDAAWTARRPEGGAE